MIKHNYSIREKYPDIYISVCEDNFINDNLLPKSGQNLVCMGMSSVPLISKSNKSKIYTIDMQVKKGVQNIEMKIITFNTQR